MHPRDLVEQGIDLLLRHDMTGFAGLWAEDGVLEFPFAAPGYPKRVEGRDAIREYLRDYPDRLDVREVTAKTVHETADPAVVVVELTVAGVVVASRKPYELSYIAVITVRDGEIRHYRDYWSPLAAAEILGGADALTAFAGDARADVLVLGGTGTTGRRVVEGLRAAGVPARAATRKPNEPGQVRFDWADRSTHAEALRGTSAVYLLAPLGEVEPARLVEPFFADALAAGVRRVVLLSSSAVTPDTPGLGELQRLVRAAPEWAVLKPSWFMQNFTGEHLVARGVRDGEIVSATGDGRIAFVDARDIAAVAVRALTDAEPHNTEHVLTGPSALSYAEAASIVAARTGRPVRHKAVSTAEFAAHLTASGMPAPFAAVLAALDEDIRRGAEDRVTPVVEQVTGRAARSFRAFAEEEIR